MTFAVSKRDKCLLIGLFGGLFLLLAWLYGATPLQEKTAALQTENVTLKAKADLYQAINANLPTYEEGIAKMERQIADIANSYPVYISREDEILFLANMENTYHSDLAVENITMSAVEEIVANVAVETQDTEAVTQEAAAATEEVVEATPAIHMYRQPVNYSFRCTYKGAKDMITHLYAQTDKKCVEGLSLAYDSATGNLMGSLDLNQYYMTGIDKNYQPTSVPTVPKGVRDVFHTVGGSAGVDSVIAEE
ncbi:MAG: hypothetical protein J6C63_05735 [Lachnospiraceae bacterium]|nr:hypothetical protein [Lachnospiraceae bacterium]